MKNPMQPRRNDGQMGINAPHEKASDRKAVFLRLLPYWAEHKGLMFLMLLCALATTASSLVTPWLIGRAIDSCIHLSQQTTVDFVLLVKYLIVLALIYIASSAAHWAQEYGMVYVSQRIVNKLRSQMMEHMQNLDLKYHDTNSRGDIMSRFLNDTELMKDGLGQTLIQCVTTIVSMVGMIVTMCALNLTLTGLICMSIPLVIFLSRFIIARSRKYFAAQQTALGNLNSVIEESINGIKVIRSFGREDKQQEFFDEINNKLKVAGTRAQINSGLMMPLLRVLDNLTYILVAVVGGSMALEGILTIGVIQTFLLYTRHFLRPVNQIASQINGVQSAFAGAERVFAMLDQKPSITDSQDAVSISKVQGLIEFKNVIFGYNSQKPILKDISFTARPGEVVAIVGSTGAGKTTLMNLLTRFYDVDSGSILLDGTDIRKIKISNLRNSLGIVLQDPVLFSGTIEKNIAYGRPSATLDMVKNAAGLAKADVFIDRLPQKYQTELVRQGENISNGQRQLLTIARAILSDAPILIFDEATSNIDTHTEILIQKAINNLTVGRTCFIIAHRLSTIRNADKILVIDNGQIAEQGNHDELLAKRGRYYEIYTSQFSVG